MTQQEWDTMLAADNAAVASARKEADREHNRKMAELHAEKRRIATTTSQALKTLPAYLPTAIVKGSYRIDVIDHDGASIIAVDEHAAITESYDAWEARCNRASLAGATCTYDR